MSEDMLHHIMRWNVKNPFNTLAHGRNTLQHIRRYCL